MYKFLYSFESNVSWSFLAAGIKKSLPYPSECLDLFGEQQILNIFLESVEGLSQLRGLVRFNYTLEDKQI